MPITRLLLDNNVSRHLVRPLRPHEAIHAATLGWAALSNGDLIRAAQAEGFSVIITCDQNIQHQQSLKGRPLAFVVLTTTHWPTILDNIAALLAAVEAAK
jgi:predicted nuclease of predicted toxin-antitoxin system